MRKCLFFIFVISLSCATTVIAGPFNSGSSGVDGAFNPTSSIEVVLPENGTLNYTTVNIPAGVTVTFKKNSANTPVYMLATGDVTIAGAISINGGSTTTRSPGKGGSGGQSGGLGASSSGMAGGKGLGPGGGNPGGAGTTAGGGGGGGFGTNGVSAGGTAGGTGGGTYANEKILPLIGGSGGGGGNYLSGGGGAGGGAGAVLIASSGTINIIGSITANGGNAPTGYGVGSPFSGGAGGSGGAIKLMANTITGNGTISAMGGNGSSYGYYPGGGGGAGRIRLEAFTVTRTAVTTPSYTYGYPNTIFVANEPTLNITSVGEVNVPANPSGTYGTPDVILPSTITNPVTVNIAATNIPAGTQVTLTAVPEYGASTSANGILSGTNALSTASVSITLPTAYQSILIVQAVFTIQTAMYYDGEKIEKIRVASAIGKGSEVTYILESGKEIPAKELTAKVTVVK